VSALVVPRPFTLVAELTYRCPLRCVYCSNPRESDVQAPELDSATWLQAFAQAKALGVWQLHLTGGEPLLRRDLELLIGGAHAEGLYVNLITSGLPLDRRRLARLVEAGLEHLQLSFQGPAAADSVDFAGVPAFERKLEVASWAKALGIPLTLNFVLHRGTIDRIEQMLELADQLHADRVELANTQYLGWAFVNRASLLPSSEQIAAARATVKRARVARPERELLFVLPDYRAGRARACMDGWANRYIVIDPAGAVLPCHAARSIPGLSFESVADAPLASIWAHSPGLLEFRGEAGLPEACRSCAGKTLDHGGCRCQAYALTGDARAVDPACEHAPLHGRVLELDHAPLVPLRLRRLSGH
jgi:pyrroloquinoline quinone biosynthesis protein E